MINVRRVKYRRKLLTPPRGRKGISAKILLEQFPDVKEKLWGGHMWNRKYANHKEVITRGSTEIISRRIYLNIYFNHVRQSADKTAFETELYELKQQPESGISVDDLSESAKKKVKK